MQLDRLCFLIWAVTGSFPNEMTFMLYHHWSNDLLQLSSYHTPDGLVCHFPLLIFPSSPLPHFPVVMLMKLYKIVLIFVSVDEILKCDHSNESYWAVLSCGAVYYAVQGGSNFWICEWNPKVWLFKWKPLRSLSCGTVYFVQCCVRWKKWITPLNVSCILEPGLIEVSLVLKYTPDVDEDSVLSLGSHAISAADKEPKGVKKTKNSTDSLMDGVINLCSPVQVCIMPKATRWHCTIIKLRASLKVKVGVH